MTKEKLLERKQTLEAELEQLRSSMAVYAGAIQDVNYWLEQLEKETKTDE